MKWVIGCWLAFSLGGEVGAEDKKPPTVTAKVVVAGKSTGLIHVSSTTGGETKKMQVALVELDDKTTLAVALPPKPADPPKKSDKDSGADPDLQRLLREATQTKVIVAQGRLSSTSNTLVIAAAGGKEAKTIPLLVAELVTDLTEANAKDFPPLGTVRVEGVLTQATHKVGRDTSTWAIHHEVTKGIPLFLPAGLTVPEAGSRVRVNGTAQIVAGRFVVQVKTVTVVK